MDLEEVMQELADQLETITGLRVHGYPPATIAPPAAVVSYPDITFDLTYGRGGDRYELPLVVAVGKAYDRASRALAAPYAAGSGDQSIKEVIEAGEYESFDSVRVSSVAFDVIAFGDVQYLAATFTLDIAGQGA